MFVKRIRTAMALLISCAMIMPVCTAAAESSDYFPHTVFKTDFESGKTTIWDRVDGAAYFTDTDEVHGTSMALNMDSDVKLWKYFDGGERYKVWHIGFEVNAEYQYINSGFKLLSKKISSYNETFTYEAFYIKLDPLRDWFIGFPRDEKNFSAPENLQNEFKYTPQKWYSVDLWVDFKDKNLFCYLDGIYYGRTALPEDFESICGMIYTSSRRDMGHTFLKNKPIGKPELWIDNFTVEGFMESTPFNNYKAASLLVPEELIRTLELNFSSTHGNINYEMKKAEFTVGIEECSGRNQKLKVNYRVTDDGGNLIGEQGEEISLAADDRYEKKISIPGNYKYGFYIFKTTATDENGKVTVKKQKFSNLHTPKENVVNTRTGFNNHFDYEYGDPEIMLPMQKKIGMSIVRDGMAWEDFEKTPHIYKTTDKYEHYTKCIEDNGLEILNTLEWHNPARSVGNPPLSDEEFEAWGEYAYEFVKQGKGRIKYLGVWNEYNARFSIFNNRGGTADDYVKLLKTAYINAKRADPDIKIIGITSARYDEAFTRRVFELGGGNYLDIVDNHPYPMNYAHGPEEGKVEETTRSLLALMKEFGLEDKECWMTELGYSSGETYMTETDQANYVIRSMAITEELVDKILWYVSICKPVTDDLEANFGFQRTWIGNDIPYEAKPAFLAISNWNALMTGAVTVEKHILEGDVRAYKFKRADGSDAYVIWTTREAKNVALNLGAEDADLYDIYGNRQKLYALGGTFNLRAAQEPIYLIGNFNRFEQAQSTVSADIKDETELCKNDEKEIAVVNNSKEALYAEMALPENISYKNENNEIRQGSSILKLETGENTEDGGNVILKINCNEKCVYYAKSAVKYINDAKVSLRVLPRGRGWQGVVSVENNTNLRTVSPVFRIDSPKELHVVGDIRIASVPPRNERTVRFNIPLSYGKDSIDIDAALIFATGEKEKISKKTNLHAIAYADKSPVIDGNISADEWKSSPILMADKSMLQEMDGWTGTDDLSASVYLMYDEKNFYVAARVKDDKLGIDGAGRPWAGDSLQFAISPEHSAGSPGTEIAFGIIKDSNTARMYMKKGVSVDELADGNIEYEIKRIDGETVYEVRVGWDELIDSFSPKKAETVNFSVLVNDNDGSGRRGWIEYGGGIGNGKNPAQYRELPLEKKN